MAHTKKEHVVKWAVPKRVAPKWLSQKDVFPSYKRRSTVFDI